MNEYTKYLATKVINEDLIVNYRQLSRNLKVHTHTAKQMLYDFYADQTSKKPGSLHATYLITGTTRSEPSPSQASNGFSSVQDEDTPMESSPFPSSFPEPYPSLSFESEDSEPAEEPVQNTMVLLVKEEELESAKDEFEDIQSIFIYSLEPGPLKDLQLLTQCNKDMLKDFWVEDPLQTYPKLGLVTNQSVRRRTGKRPPPTPASTVPKKESDKAISAKKSLPQAPSGKHDPVKSVETKPAALKHQTSDLFKSFSKSQPPKSKPTNSDITAPSGTNNQADKDEEMQGMSEEEASDIDEEMLEAEAQKAEVARKAREETKAKLRDMMDAEDEDKDMKDVDDEEAQDPIDESQALDVPQEESKEEVTVSNGRRRGRRRIMKKRTFKDEDGYLVTKEEPGWESFSEDEPTPKKPKVAVAPLPAKKGAPAPRGQGNLMAFFKKK